MSDGRITASRQVEFIDDSAIDWSTVRRTRCQFYQRFHYEYPGPIHDLKQRLVIVPADRYGAQHLLDHHLVINPSPLMLRQLTDSFGNRVLELEVPQAERVVSFEALMIVESEAPARRSVISPSEAQYFQEHTPLTMPDEKIRQVAQQLKQETDSSHALAQRINDWV